jgi:UDP-N-acetylglucosamine--N-acetylmuramyl-(pentapeptide) pyrophosphoryl-undecaprenol N-acetylglucosamine transferase
MDDAESDQHVSSFGFRISSDIRHLAFVISSAILYRVTTRDCYLFAGGGTGGHLTPGLAVAAELLKSDGGCRVVFAGSDRALEQKLIAAAGYEHHALPIESSSMFRRNLLRVVWRAWGALRIASRLIERESPRAVIGLGGFASVPVVVAALRRRIPTLILEQNAVPGRATRFFSRRVGAVCTTFDQAKSFLASGSHVIVTGNPVREPIADLWRTNVDDDAPRAATLLILGGSQGAETVNDAVVELLLRRPQALAGWQVVHQTGEAQHAQVLDAYRGSGRPHVVKPFFDDLAGWYARATLAISRAGATTLAELACAGCPAVLLPYPHAADNHQKANARVFEAAGAALVVEHDRVASTTLERLSIAVSGLAESPQRLAGMRQSMRDLARPQAASKVAQVLQSLTAGSMR